MALRNGIAERPRPGSSAIRTPRPTVTGVRVTTVPTRDGYEAAPADLPRGAWAPAKRHAVHPTAAKRRTTMAAAPIPRTAALASSPGMGSAKRAGPSGVSGDNATAMATANPAPITVAAATSTRRAAGNWTWD